MRNNIIKAIKCPNCDSLLELEKVFIRDLPEDVPYSKKYYTFICPKCECVTNIDMSLFSDEDKKILQELQEKRNEQERKRIELMEKEVSSWPDWMFSSEKIRRLIKK